ncbi:MAG: flagellar basal body L-ring protein FlgH [Gammaproteobacteria bacterium]|nr:flagellar basal body L-ring protein FlgH [Gammaproteobacteria bacterium]
MSRPHLPLACVALLLAACRTAPEHIGDFAATEPEPLPAVTARDGAIYQAGHDLPLFENPVARRVGDVLTITLEERTQASKSATTSTSKKTKAELPGPKLAGAPVTANGREILDMALDHSSTFAGSGDSAQSNQLSGAITVTVARRLPNGNLLVRGQKWMTLNQGREYVRIQGIVRPVDIAPDNSVASYKVADAQIEYGSQGVLAAANSKSLLARFFDSKWMPF